MSATAYLLKEQFRPSGGLDRTFVRELWHVKDIVGWTKDNTSLTVIPAIPASRRLGQPHPDPGYANAICTGLSLMDGPWVSLDNTATMEALVLATFDSDRRWGAAGFMESGITSEMKSVMIPCFCGSSGTSSTQRTRNDFWYERSMIKRVEYRDGTGMSETERSNAIGWSGSMFTIFGQKYVLASPSITRMPTNQVIIKYIFAAKGPVRAFPVSGSRIVVAIPELKRMDEYIVDNSGGGSITVQTAADLYGTDNDPTQTLPFWERRLY